MRARFFGCITSSVRMLCRRSASLIRITRTSRAIASSILRKFSACACFLGLELDAVELGNAVHELGHMLAELVADLVLGDGSVLHHVVQQRGGQRLAVEVPLGEDLGHRDRVGDIGIAGLAELALVGGFAELVRALELNNVLRLEIAGCVLEQ